MKGVGKLLRDLSIDPSMMGYSYLMDAMELLEKDHDAIYLVTKKIYPVVAKKRGVTAARVERCMRNAIERGFDNLDCDLRDKYFGNLISLNSGRVTNSTFMATLYEILHEEEEDV